MKRIILMVVTNLFFVIVCWPKLCRMAAHPERYTKEERWKHLQFWVERACKGGRIILEAHGQEKLPEEPFILYPNHQGMFDVPMLISIPNTVIYSPSCYEELRMCLNQAIFKEKYITAIRYPRGCDKTVFDKSNLNLSYTFTENDNSDILLVSYGRIYDEIYKAQSILNGDGISCSLLKLTKIFPLDNEIIKKSLKYKRIIFFEESYGGISVLFGDNLLENGYKGSYEKVTAEGFVKQASIKSCLEKIGLTCEKIVEFVRKRSFSE